MIMLLGNVVFQVAPVGIDEIDHRYSSRFAIHPVLGSMPLYEKTGIGPEGWRIRATLMPEFCQRHGIDTGLFELDQLKLICQSGMPQFLMRGDGKPMGWVIIQDVVERSRVLSKSGIGRQITLDIDVIATNAPSFDGFYSLG